MIIVVSPGQSIQVAVDAARPGDTILVKAGVFRESVSIGPDKERIRITGEGRGKTILDGTGLAGASGFHIAGSSFVTIAGFSLRHFERCAVVIRTSDNVIRENELASNGLEGVEMAGGRNLFKGNHVAHNRSHGIKIAKEGGFNYIIANRISENGGCGIHTAGNHTVAFNNEIRNNGSDGVSISAIGGWILFNKLLANKKAGIDLQSTVDVLLLGNEVKANEGVGIQADVSGLIAIQNKLNENKEDGFAVAVATDTGSANLGLRGSFLFQNEMSRNTLDGLDGRAHDSFLRNLILENRIVENGDAGVDLDGVDLCRILFNDVDANKLRGIELGASSGHNVVDDNSLEDNRAGGIWLTGDCGGNAVRANVFKSNKAFDIQADPPADVQNTFDLEDEA